MTMQPHTHGMTIEQRLARLELSARRWRRVSVGLGLLLAVGIGLAAVAQSEPQDLVVKSLRIGPDKEPLVLIGIDKVEHSGSIELHGVSPTLFMNGKNCSVYMQGNNGTNSLMSVSDDNGSTLSLTSTPGDGKILLAAKGGATISSLDLPQSKRGFALTNDNKSSSFVIYDKDGNEKLRLP